MESQSTHSPLQARHGSVKSCEYTQRMNKEVEDKVGEVFFTHSEGLSKKCRFGPLSLCYFILFIYLIFFGGVHFNVFDKVHFKKK